MAAAPRSIVDSYVSFIKELKLEPLALEVSLEAIARSIIPKKDKKNPTIIIDIGARTTNMAVFRENIKIAASNPIGAETIKESLASVLSCSPKEANSELVKGISREDKASKVIKNEVNNIINEIDKIKKYYEERYKDNAINQILLCGGIGSMNGLAEYIEERTNIKTKAGNPWTNISVYPLKPVPKKEAGMYAAAIGLCLSGEEDE